MPGPPGPVESRDPESIERVFERISDAVFGLDEAFQFTFLNPRAEQLLGTDADDLLGKRIWDAYPEIEETEIAGTLREALDTQQVVQGESYYEPLDIWVDARIYPSETGLSVYVRDITEEKHRELELDFRSALLEAQAETTIHGQLVVDEDQNILYYNQQFAELWGIPEEVLAERSDELAVEYVLESLADPDEFVERIEYLYEHPHEESRDEIKLADGRWFDRYSAPVIASDGTHYGRLWLFRDITDRKKRERELEEAKAQLEAAIEAGAVGTWEWHIQEDEIVTGAAFAHLFGVDPEAAREGTSLDQFISAIHEDDRERVERKVEEAVASCGEYEAEYRVWNADDELRWVIARGHVECDEDGNPVRFPGALTDITDRKRIEQEREELIEQLEASNDRLEQFAYAASHDLQEPLRMVSTYLQLIEDRYRDALDEDGREFLGVAVDGADRMREMINSLLEYSRIRTDGEPLEPVELTAVVDDVVTDLQLRIEESGAEIAVDDLPRVEGDAGQLRQLFQNLLENALEYSGDEPPHVEISAERDGPEWVISVSDEGIGIETDNHERVFEVFKRLHTQAEHPGTGIGLAICEQIVARHDGDIWIDSEPGEGTTVSFTLPAAGTGAA